MDRNSGEHDIAILWSESDLQCVLSFDGSRYRLRLTLGSDVLEEQSSHNDQVLIAIADGWKAHRRSPSGRHGAHAAVDDESSDRPCLSCGSVAGLKPLRASSNGAATWFLCGACGHVFAVSLE